MGGIQEIHALEQRIYDIGQCFVDGNYKANDVLTIGKRCGKSTLKAKAKDTMKLGKSIMTFLIKDLKHLDDTCAVNRVPIIAKCMPIRNL